MTGIRARGEDVRKFVIEHIDKHPTNISRMTAEHFNITKQAVSRHLRRLIDEGIISESGNTRNKSYKLCPLFEWRYTAELKPGLAEDVVWIQEVKPRLGHLPDNVLNIWHHGFTEMFNNAIDHSGGSKIGIEIKKTAAETEMFIVDDGIGIFRKIQAALDLLDERHAVLELAKGKFTTDPNNHSGEGIFFTSRMFDVYSIVSGGVYFTHNKGQPEDWITELSSTIGGTGVYMKLHNHTSRTTRKIFEQYTSDDEEFKFNKTVVPVKLARYGDDNLISRSQAKRLLARVELFKIVILDFKEVPSIGQAFADEIFRVFANRHPEVQIVPMHFNSEIRRMINRVTNE